MAEAGRAAEGRGSAWRAAAEVISTAHLRFHEQGGILREQWEAFCAEHEIAYAPSVAGRNVWLRGGKTGIECVFGDGMRGDAAKGPPDYAEHVQLSTFWGGPRAKELAAIAGAIWVRFGGSLFADEQTRKLICEGERERT